MGSGNIAWTKTQDPLEGEVLEFRIERPGKRDITGALWAPPNVRADSDLVCFGHGASGDRFQAPIVPMAHRFVQELGCPVLSLDGPVHGLRQVGAGGREAFGPEFVRDACVSDMVEEWTVVVEAAREKTGCQDGRLAYFGLSMGSIFGIPFLATRDDVSVATLGLAGLFDGLPHRNEMADGAAGLSAPVLFLLQLEDELFPRDACLALYDQIGSEDKRIHANPGLHPNIPQDEVDFAFEFMAAHLRGTGGRNVLAIAE